MQVNHSILTPAAVQWAYILEVFSMDDMQEQKDQNVMSFMMQLVQEKHGDDTDMDFLNQEAGRLYDVFGDNLVDYFEPMLSPEQKSEFDVLVEKGENQDGLLNYLIASIPDLENQILQVLVQFREQYLNQQQEA